MRLELSLYENLIELAETIDCPVDICNGYSKPKEICYIFHSEG